jgi:hypothetical protein
MKILSINYLKTFRNLMGSNLSNLVTRDTAVTNLDEPVIINIRKNDNNQASPISQIEQPINGTVVDNKDGTVTYTPNEGFIGNDAFAYGVNGIITQEEDLNDLDNLAYDFTLVNISVLGTVYSPIPFIFLGAVYALTKKC